MSTFLAFLFFILLTVLGHNIDKIYNKSLDQENTLRALERTIQSSIEDIQRMHVLYMEELRRREKPCICEHPVDAKFVYECPNYTWSIKKQSVTVAREDVILLSDALSLDHP